MKIRINGKAETVEAAGSLGDILTRRGLSVDKIVVEHNCRIVPKEDLPGIHIKEGDVIEIVSFVGGG